MRQASGILYLLGSLMALILACVAIPFGISNVASSSNPTNSAPLLEIGIGLLVAGALAIITLIIGIIGFRANQSGQRKVGIHIVALVASVLSLDILLFVAAILGLVGKEK